MLKIQSTGKNVDDAILNGTIELKVRKEDVNVTIIEKGGLFKKATVELIVKPEVEEMLNNRMQRIQQLEEQIAKVEQKEEVEDNQKQEEKHCVKQDEIIENVVEEIDATEVLNNVENVDVCPLVVEFVKNYFEMQNIVPTIQVEKQTKDDIYLLISGEGTQELIGFRGEGINALQYICNIYASRINANCPRVFINIGTFKEDREQELIKLARRLATKVAKTKQRIKLDAMPAYERKIIHKALQNDDFVQTFSIGFEPKRSLIIDVKNKN